MDVVVYISLGLLGLIMGSFAGASVWRLRAKQLVDDRSTGEKVNSKELKTLLPLTKKTFLTDRSRCLGCGHELRWFDMIPLISWISLKGKCRNCKKSIGYFEPVIEVSLALFFILSYAFWPFELTSSIEIIRFTLWGISGVICAILFSYDYKWFLLPNIATGLLALVGLAMSVITVVVASDSAQAGVSIISSVGILSGIYAVLYLVSRGSWIGFGDVKLGVGLGLVLSDWRLAVVALIAANLIGTILVLPGLISGKLKSSSHVQFGPLLIVGMIGAYLFGMPIVSWYSDMLVF